VFALTKQHASRLCQYLNQLHPEHDGRYAEVITSDIQDADAAIRRFKKDIYPMVAVSVDMLTTGFDCREVLHIVLCRKIFSPILYQQIRGRGTRTAPHIGKKLFVIYDFFRNHEYFNDSETDIFEGPTGIGGGGGKPGPKGTGTELVELGIQDDWLEALAYVEVGPNGERVDKKVYISNWEESIRAQDQGQRTFDGIGRASSGQPTEPPGKLFQRGKFTAGLPARGGKPDRVCAPCPRSGKTQNQGRRNYRKFPGVADFQKRLAGAGAISLAAEKSRRGER
jgi:type I restriction enzyme R subunit